MTVFRTVRIAGIAAGIASAAAAAAIFLPASFAPHEPQEVFIRSGMGPIEIGRALQREGIIRSPHLFAFYTILRGTSLRLQAGYYDMSPRMPLWLVAERIAEGDVAVRRFTLQEGWDLRAIASALEREGLAVREDFFLATGQPATFKQDPRYLVHTRDINEEVPMLQGLPEGASLEGFLFPDTYFLHRGASTDDIVLAFLREFRRSWDMHIAPSVPEDRDSLDILILASLLEKEVRGMEDKRMVADILLRRLKEGIPLQVDASVQYATGRNAIRTPREDTLIDSAYNTYAASGLPPAPISNPGLESIRAALDPLPNPYWFYLSAPDGETIYSRTYEDHLRAIAQYL